MILRGINYDIGTEFRKGKLSRPDFDEDIIRKELEIIKHELHCDAIRISGLDVKRLIKTTEYALEIGFQVWLSPAFIEATIDEAIPYLVECAKAAEELRIKNEKLIFVVGCEYSLFMKGFIKGETIYDRLKIMFSPIGIVMNLFGFRQPVYTKLNKFLKDVSAKIRKEFNGKLTYASGTWEKIDWNLFDFVGIDHYRASFNKTTYVKTIRNYFNFKKPVVILEFGCCTYQGAEDKGGAGWAILEIKDNKPQVNGNYIRDETIQANYIIDLLNIFKEEKIYAAFVFTFINPMYKYNPEPKLDLDMASYGIVKPVDSSNNVNYKGLAWIPKEAFYQLSEYYKSWSDQ